MLKGRFYPSCCLSAACPKCGPECNASCPGWPTLQEFKRWRKASNAKRLDPIWSPTYYEPDLYPGTESGKWSHRGT